MVDYPAVSGLYRYEAIRELHLEVTSKCNLSCPMCARNVFGGRPSPNLEPIDMSLQRFTATFEPELLGRLETLLLCGNYGDPCVAQDTLPILEYARRLAPDALIIVHTHGSARRPEWWRRLAAVRPRVVFGIDGLEDTLSTYRRGARFAQVMENAAAFIEAGGAARWQFLAFAHNEHQIEAARARAADMGFERFKVKHTHRFYKSAFVPRGEDGRPDPSRPPRYPVYDADGVAVGVLEPPRRAENRNPGFEEALGGAGGSGFRRLREAAPIDCKVLRPASVYVSADGLVFPCCWTGNVYAASVTPDHPVLALADRHAGGLEGLRVPPRTLQEVVDGPFFTAIAESWARPSVAEGRLRTCANVCGGGQALRARGRLA